MWRLLFVFILSSFFSCSSDDNNPYQENSESELRVVSVAYLRSLYTGSVSVISENIAIDTYLVSSDREGNFYHSLVFQDSTGGIELSVDLDDSYNSFNYLTSYRIYCKGLYPGGSSDNISMGAYTGYYYVGDLPESTLSSYIVSTGSYFKQYTFRTISELSDIDLSTLVVLTGATLSDVLLTDNQGNSVDLIVGDYDSFSSNALSGSCVVMGVIGKSEGRYNISVSLNSDISIL